jgi:hypothetical protein
VRASLLVVPVLALLVLTACQPAAGARSPACNSMLAAAQELNTTKAAVTGLKPVLVVHQVRETTRSARQKIDATQATFSAARDSENLLLLKRNLDQMDVGLQGVPDSTLIPQVRSRLTASAVAAADSATALYNAVCAAR